MYITKLYLFIGIPYVTDCIVGELEKLGQKYKIALKIVKDPRFERIQCMHPGTYADDCLVQRVTQVILSIFNSYKNLILKSTNILKFYFTLKTLWFPSNSDDKLF